MAISKSEAPDPEEFVRDQISNHVGHDVYDLDDKTAISGTVVRSIMEALDRKILPTKPVNLSCVEFCGSYTLSSCIEFVRARIKSKCSSGPSKE